eukprot:superscaffoldBa00002629_g14841
MFPSRWRFSWDRFTEVDLFTDRYDANAESLSQAIRAAASEEPDADGSVLFGQLKGTVVGLRYYTGVVNQGEMVGLVREPQNPYDRNAVKVTNVYGSQVGHIKRELAAAMAHVMDNKLAKVEGVVHSGTNNSFNMPVMLSFWGKEENKNAVNEVMARRGYKLNTGGIKPAGVNQKSYNSSGARGPMASKKGLTIPLTADESVGTPLLLHQKQALSWMCARENKCALPPFWEKRGELYYNSLTCFSAKEIPERVRGGILADDMGLGKTLTTIALILTNFHKGKPLPVEKCEEQSSPRKAKSQMASKPEGSSSAGDTAAGSLRTDPPQAEVICVDTPDVAEKAGKSEKSTDKGKMKATKRKPSKEGPVLLEDLDFAAALGGSTSDTSSKKKKTDKKAAPSPSVESSFTESADDLSARTTLIICPLSVLSNWLETARCPLCRGEIKASELVEFPQEEIEEENSANSVKWRTSSKVQALMGNLFRLRSEDSSVKCLVVSQFTRFLNILATPLREHGFSFVRLDGTMSQKKRAQVIQEFQSSAADSPSIMLLSLKAGGVGLNLTAASHVFLMDPFIVKDSVEENMVKIQRQKQDLVEKAFGSTNTDRKTSRIDDIKALMEL